MVVHLMEAVDDDEEAPVRVAGAQAAEGLGDLDDPLAPSEDAVQHVSVHVVEAEEDLDALFRVYVARIRAGSPRRAQQRPPIGRHSSGPHSSKLTTADRGGQRRTRERMRRLFLRTGGRRSASRCGCAGPTGPLGGARGAPTRR